VSSEDARIRLEGRLELLEAALLLLTELEHFANRDWHRHTPVVKKLLDAWHDDALQRESARDAAKRVEGAQKTLRSLNAVSKRLTSKLDRVLADTACRRANGLDAKLLVWGDLLRSHVTERSTDALASGTASDRSWEWLITVPAGIAVIALGQPLLLFVLLAQGIVWWSFGKREYVWRVCRDSIDIEDLTSTDPVRVIPIRSIESIEHVRDRVNVRGLHDVTLRGSAMLDFALKARQLHAEVLARQKFEHASEPALWLEASLQDATGRTRATNGFVLVCNAGLAYVPSTQLKSAWSAIVEAPPADHNAYLAGALRTLPAKLLEQRLQAVREVDGVIQLDGYADFAWQSLGDILLVTLDDQKKLFINCAASVQERLTQIRETRKG
jgi:hypothetical protein